MSKFACRRTHILRYLRYFVKATIWLKILECPLMKKRKAIQNCKKTKYCKQVNSFLLFNFVLFPYRQRNISKYLVFVLIYVSITNRIKRSTNLLTMKHHLWKIQILRHSNDFKIGILVALLVGIPADRQTFQTNEKGKITSYKTCSNYNNKILGC